MPLNAAKLNSAREEFDWEYMGEVIHVVYNPQGFTPEIEHTITDAMDGKYKGDGMISMLLSMLIDWDVTEYVPDEVDESGKVLSYKKNAEGELLERPFGVAPEKLQKLPVKFLGDCATAITKEIQGAVEEGKDSGAGLQLMVQ